MILYFHIYVSARNSSFHSKRFQMINISSHTTHTHKLTY